MGLLQVLWPEQQLNPNWKASHMTDMKPKSLGKGICDYDKEASCGVMPFRPALGVTLQPTRGPELQGHPQSQMI